MLLSFVFIETYAHVVLIILELASFGYPFPILLRSTGHFIHKFALSPHTSFRLYRTAWCRLLPTIVMLVSTFSMSA